jgi:transposase
MAAERLSMRTIKEILRLKWENQLSNTQIALSCNIARSTIRSYLERAQKAGLTWPLCADLDDADLERLLFVPEERARREATALYPMEHIHKELARKGVTLRLLWLEYREANPDGYQYSQFCHHYRNWAAKLDTCLRQTYRAGEKLFVDYAGQTIPVLNPVSGESRNAHLFVATLGASNYTFVEASFAQDLPSWISSHVKAFTFFGGVPEIIVPDNLKSGVVRPCRYEPDINPTYHDMARHYGTVIIPARVRKPRDKAKVESAVLVVERWIAAALRNQSFFSLGELNQAIAEKLTELNSRKFQKVDASRKEIFDTIDRPALKPIPSVPYEYAEWKKARVNIDYHIEVDGHYYSVPYQLVKEQVDVRLTSRTVEVLFKNRRVASHPRQFQRGQHTTVEDHMPRSHRFYHEWTPSRIIRWAGQNGPHTENLVVHIMEARKHPEQGFRSSLGIMRLGKRYSPERLEAACARALQIKAYSYRSVESILRNGLDRHSPALVSNDSKPPVQHANIRGKDYYLRKELSHA